MKNYDLLPQRSRFLKNNIHFIFHIDYCYNSLSIVVFLFNYSQRIKQSEPFFYHSTHILPATGLLKNPIKINSFYGKIIYYPRKAQ